MGRITQVFEIWLERLGLFPVVFFSKIAIENVYSSREWALVEPKLSVLKPVNDNILVFVQPCTNNNYRIIFLPDKNFASGRGSKKNSVFKVPIWPTEKTDSKFWLHKDFPEAFNRCLREKCCDKIKHNLFLWKISKWSNRKQMAKILEDSRKKFVFASLVWTIKVDNFKKMMTDEFKIGKPFFWKLVERSKYSDRISFRKSN